MRLLSVAPLLPFFLAASAVQISDPSQLSTHTFDYIIVGGGVAGNVVARRLSEDESRTVLVLEAGFNVSSDVDTHIPFLGPTLAPDTPLDWNYTTVSQPGLNGRAIPYARGKALGGSSIINYMVYNRGSEDDWNNYARIAQDPFLSWPAMQYYLDKVENFVRPNTTRDVTDEYNPKFHGTNGPLGVSLPDIASVSMDEHVIKTTQDFPSEFPYQQDQNAGNPIGIGWAQGTIVNGTRTDAEGSYLRPIISRPNLVVLTGAQVTRVYNTTSTHGIPVFSGVEFATGPTAKRIQLTASREIILAAGSFNTPQLLMLSGIGDQSTLKSLNIKPVVDLPSVGQNMSDHVILANSWRIDPSVNDTINDYQNPANLPGEFAQWASTGTGPLSETGFRQIAWLRIPENDTIWKNYTDPSAGNKSAHFEIIFAHGLVGGTPAPGEKFMGMATNVIATSARGNVSLVSNDPFAKPNINPNLLGSPLDKYIAAYALKTARRIAASKAFEGYVRDSGNYGNLTTDDELENYASENAGTVWHAMSTACVSPYNASWGVINPDLQVKRTIGLSVIDASGVPYVPTGHTQGIVYAWAERGADLIKLRNIW